MMYLSDMDSNTKPVTKYHCVTALTRKVMKVSVFDSVMNYVQHIHKH